MLKKLPIAQICYQEGEFLSRIFLVGERMGGKRSAVDLKNLNEFVPYQNFKMESLHCLNFFLQKDDYMCKIDLKYAYFSVPLHKDSQKLVRF